MQRYRLELTNRESNFNRMFTDHQPVIVEGKGRKPSSSLHESVSVNTLFFQFALSKKATKQSPRVLLVVLILQFVDVSISGKTEKMAQGTMDVCFRVYNDSSKSRFDSYIAGNIPFGIVA